MPIRNHLLHCRHWKSIFYASNQNGRLHSNGALHHCSETSNGEIPPLEWYIRTFPRLTKLAQSLKSVDFIDGKLVNVHDDSTANDERMLLRMHKFKTLTRVFLRSPSVLEEVNKNVQAAMADQKSAQSVLFSNPYEREPMLVDSLTAVCNFLGVSAQQRKVVRFTICPQVTRYKIWTGALEQTLKDLQTEMGSMECKRRTNGLYMAEQIAFNCLGFLAETVNCHGEDACSWMRPKPKRVAGSLSSHRWGEVLEMFSDLIDNLKDEGKLSFHVSKLVAMKEGLYQVKDVYIDRNIGYREVQHQENLVQRKLSATLGHSSRCLFTLIHYYLYGTIRDIEIEVCGGLYELGGQDQKCLYMGKILTSDEDLMVWRGIKQLDRALGLFKFVWDSAQMKGNLELQGHLWCAGAEQRTLTYRKKPFFIHRISV